MKFAINPPSTPIVDADRNVTPAWYRYFVQQRKQGDDITDADVLTIGQAQDTYPDSRALAVATGQLTKATDDTNLTLGLADSGVTAMTYGAATKLVVLAIDAKGRVTAASEITLSSSNVAEGTNLYFTDARARAALSGAGGIDYTAATGVIDTTGFSGTVTPVTSITVSKGIVTNVS